MLPASLQVKCGKQVSVVLTDDGRLYTMGRGARGVLGHGQDLLMLASPRQIDSLHQVRVTSVDCRGEHIVAVTDLGLTYSWGANAEGQLGHGDRKDRLRPEKIESLTTSRIKMAVTGAAHSLFLDTNGTVWGCGQGEDGELGMDTNESFSSESFTVLSPQATSPCPNACHWFYVTRPSG